MMAQNSSNKMGWLPVTGMVFVAIIIVTGLFSGPHNIGPWGGWGAWSGISYEEAFLLVLLGFVSGSVGGMLGMGGGVLKVIILHLLLGFTIPFARVVSLLSYVVISLSSFMRYRKYGLVLWGMSKLLIISSILGVLIGVVIGSWINIEYVEILLGIYALCTGVIVLNQMWVNPTEEEISELDEGEVNETTVSGIGFGMGLISSLIGISGGILSTPLQQTLLKIPLKNAIANSITAAIFCSFTGSIFLLYSGVKSASFLLEDVFIVAICLVPGNILGAQFGSSLTKRLHVNYVRVTFVVVIFAIGFRILLI
ncbi:MAG: sulfite exporter TauE/SafE family protein [Candidatus Latescibacteria bacterium]|nr:sulfite exporter TauE/SafE family protein [Candidatus Latescibacterota bacterium]